MRLIVGLGNPGTRHEATPHNLGFLVVDALARELEIGIRRPEADALLGLGRCGDEEVLLAKPQTFMNLSGRAVSQLLERFELKPQDLIVVVDDLDLPWRQLRIRERGGAGTHNGLRSVAEAVGTDFPRVRMGIQPGFEIEDAAQFVLAPWSRRQQEDVEEFVARGAQAARAIASDGVAAAMNRFNGTGGPETDRDEAPPGR